MKKVFGRLVALTIIMLLIISMMHLAFVLYKQKDVKRVYMISPSTEVLFIGSSQVGCSIDEDKKGVYHLQKLWVSATITPSYLMRLKELDRRRQLDMVKTVICPFSIQSVYGQSRYGYLMGWYKELPVSWRYLDMLPYSKREFAWYILCNLRIPFPMCLSEIPPDREGLASRSETYRNKVLLEFKRMAREVQARGSSPEWETRLFDAYRTMDEICKRHGIRFVVYRAPMLPDYERNLPAEARHQIAIYEKRLCDMGIEYIKPQLELDDQYFFDYVHLTKSGAERFTFALFQELKK